MSEAHRVAIIIPTYNMPERTHDLCQYIEEHVQWPYDLIVVDNGSQPQFLSDWTTVKVSKNVQTCGGWLMGLHYADHLAIMRGSPYFAYWIMITSTEFVLDGKDPLSPLVELMMALPESVVVHPALTTDSTTALKHLIAQQEAAYRKTFLVDNIAALWRADWLNSVGRFDPLLTFGWGVLPETCWKARRDGKELYIHEGVQIKKVTDIGYTMDRMGMTAEERRIRASAQVKGILGTRYGPDYLEKLGKEFA